jgi:hypothetical protein
MRTIARSSLLSLVAFAGAAPLPAVPRRFPLRAWTDLDFARLTDLAITDNSLL